MEKRVEAFGRLLEVMDELRVKCPWDREQTFESLRNNTIEEMYELVDALLDEDMENIRKELGDLLLHIVFYAKIGEEQQAFDISDVANGICDKLIYRHPHIFGDVVADTPQQVMQNWEELKLKEKRGKNEKKGVLAGVPRTLPALVKAYRIGQKAASAGFDWEQKEDVWAKVKEEAQEVQEELQKPDNHAAMEDEFGDLLFSLVNAARLYGVDPELALERTNRKFIKRFNHIEQGAVARGVALRELTLAQMEELWEEAKQI